MVKSPVMACSPERIKARPHALNIRVSKKQYRAISELARGCKSSINGVVETAIRLMIDDMRAGYQPEFPKDGRRK